jgi:simple sugar transport system ATP-binding protein
MSAPPDPPLLVVRGLTKRFGSVVANDGIDFDVRRGEIHALLGENGAGKSTLMNVLFGLVDPDGGDMSLRGEPYAPRSPADAIRAGIGMVHQHFMLVPVFSVIENVILGDEPTRGPALDLQPARQRLRALAREFGLDVDPDAPVRDLPIGVQQRVEILKALHRRADLLILDEPTAVLAPPEVEQLFHVLRDLTASGHAVILISHKLREVLSVADRVTVLRRGRVVGTVVPSEASEASLAAMMVGEAVDLSLDKAPSRPGAVVLQVQGLRVRDERGTVAVRDLDLQVRAGEIVGVAGVEGNGQTELVEALAGVRAPEAGQILLDGVPVTDVSPTVLTLRGVGRIPEDRQRHGLVLAHPLSDNFVLSRFDRPPFARGLQRRFDQVRTFARRLVDTFDVRTPSVDTRAGALSGGNQQKAVVARELAETPRLLIAAQPTRGIDVGAIQTIHRRLLDARDSGSAILLVSAELEELLAIADRIVVVYRGQVVAERAASDTSVAELGLLISGGGRAAPAHGQVGGRGSGSPLFGDEESRSE